MRKKCIGNLLIISLSLPLIFFSCYDVYSQQQQQNSSPLAVENITLSDPNLKLELVTSGLDFPTTMAFLGPNDFLILEKNTGNVKRVINSTLIEKPVLHVDTNIKDERGLLGIAVIKKENFYDEFFIENKNLTHNVFLYFIECNEKKSRL